MSISSEESKVVPKTIGTTIFDVEQPAPVNAKPSKKCSRKCCFISTALGVFFGLLIIGTITYLLMVHESQCYRGCHRVCDSENQHDCRADCWKVCWRAQWSKCPEHGAKVCAYTLWDKTMVNVLGWSHFTSSILSNYHSKSFYTLSEYPLKTLFFINKNEH